MAVDEFEDSTADSDRSAPEGGRDDPGPDLEERVRIEVGLGWEELQGFVVLL